MEDSPISDAALEEHANRVNKAFRIVRKRAPRDVQKRVRQALEQVYAIVQEGTEVQAATRLRLARTLEDLMAELRGRSIFVPQLYQGGRLGLVWFWDPIKIKTTVDPAAINDHFQRYEERIDRSERRVHWFLERCGMQSEEPPAKKPWEVPYAAFEEVHELIWGRVDRAEPPQ